MPLHALTRFREEDLRPGEKIIFRVRRHWIAFVYNMLRPVVIVLGVLIITALLLWTDTLNISFDLADIIIWLIILGTIAYYVLIKMWTHYIDWQYDEDILTNMRIIDVDQHFLIGRDIGIAELGQIEDVSFRHKGILSTLFNYGDIDIQTAATAAKKEHSGEGTFLLHNVPNPQKTQRIISETVYAFNQKNTRQYNNSNQVQPGQIQDGFVHSTPQANPHGNAPLPVNPTPSQNNQNVNNQGNVSSEVNPQQENFKNHPGQPSAKEFDQ